ncbi:MAG TPA: DUF72 domain-containing protein [Chloroflexia bacterium]|nr:DUF72 domain-containing protein [Chloroflexia bacterium]
MTEATGESFRRIKIGCCGFAAAQKRYAELFPVIEVQQTFYQPPQLPTLQRWRETFPADFEFTLKAWQLITHEGWSKTYSRLKISLTEQERREAGFFKATSIVHQGWETTYECAVALQAQLVLFQCPASFKPTKVNLERMRSFFSGIERGPLKLLWEPRGDWPIQLVTALCQELNLIHAVDPFVQASVTPELTYYRLHGGEGYRHDYDDEELKKLITLIPAQGESYVMFNNINMLENARRFEELLKTELPEQDA